MTDVCPFSLGIATKNDKSDHYARLSVLIPKNSILPTSKTQIFNGLVPFQTNLALHVYQGEEIWCMDNLDLGTFHMKLTPNEKGDTIVQVTFSYDTNGLLEVAARDLIGGHTLEAIVTQKASLLSPEEIEKKRQALKASQKSKTITLSAAFLSIVEKEAFLGSMENDPLILQLRKMLDKKSMVFYPAAWRRYFLTGNF